MALREIGNPAVIGMTIAGEDPEGNVFVRLQLYPARTPNPHAVPVEQELEHHGWMICRMSALKMQILLGDLPEIQGIDQIADKQGKMILWQPFSHIRRKL